MDFRQLVVKKQLIHTRYCMMSQGLKTAVEFQLPSLTMPVDSLTCITPSSQATASFCSVFKVITTTLNLVNMHNASVSHALLEFPHDITSDFADISLYTCS